VLKLIEEPEGGVLFADRYLRFFPRAITVNRRKKYSDFGKMKCSKFGNKSTVFLGTTLQ